MEDGDLHGGSYQLEYTRGVPAVVNNAGVVQELSGVYASKNPEAPAASEGLASLIGDDVSYFLLEVPGGLLYIGS